MLYIHNSKAAYRGNLVNLHKKLGLLYINKSLIIVL